MSRSSCQVTLHAVVECLKVSFFDVTSLVSRQTFLFLILFLLYQVYCNCLPAVLQGPFLIIMRQPIPYSLSSLLHYFATLLYLTNQYHRNVKPPIWGTGGVIESALMERVERLLDVWTSLVDCKVQVPSLGHHTIVIQIIYSLHSA